MFFITFTCPVGLLAAVGRLLATLPRDRCGPSLGRRGGAATSKNRPDTTPPLKKTWILMINACTLQLMRTGTRSRAHGAASTADPAPLRARISTARITPIRRRNAPRRLAAASGGRQTARLWTSVGNTGKEGGISTQGGPYDALTCLKASARERGFVGRRAREQRT